MTSKQAGPKATVPGNWGSRPMVPGTDAAVPLGVSNRAAAMDAGERTVFLEEIPHAERPRNITGASGRKRPERPSVGSASESVAPGDASLAENQSRESLSCRRLMRSQPSRIRESAPSAPVQHRSAPRSGSQSRPYKDHSGPSESHLRGTDQAGERVAEASRAAQSSIAGS